MKKQLKFFVMSMLVIAAFAISGCAVSAACTHQWKVYSSYSHVSGTKKHSVTYKCDKCGEKEERQEACVKRITNVYYDQSDDRKSHIKVSEYRCFDCGYSYTTKAKPAAHSFTWMKVASYVRGYQCKTCHVAYSYKHKNSDGTTSWWSLYDPETYSYCIVEPNETKKGAAYLPGYLKKVNPVKSISYSKKGICKVTTSAEKINVKGLKKGVCVVKIKMKSGSVQTLTVRVKK